MEISALEIDQAQEDLYEEALGLMETGELFLKLSKKQEHYRRAAQLFAQAGDFRDAPERMAQCEAAAGEALEDEKAERYAALEARAKDPSYTDYEKLEKELLELGDYRESGALLQKCREDRDRSRRKRRVRRGVVWTIAAVALAGIVWMVGSGFFHVVMGMAYERADMGSYALASYRKLEGRFSGEARYAACEMRILQKAREGETVTFGDYRWRLLKKKKKAKTALLVAAGIEEGHDFYGVAFEDSADASDVTWEDSSLRAWLNDVIYQEGFTDEERQLILPRERKTTRNDAYGTSYMGTTDYLAPLTLEEFERYAKEAGSSGGDSWIATPGSSMDTVCFVTSMNTVRTYGMPAGEKISVRPAILISLEG